MSVSERDNEDEVEGIGMRPGARLRAKAIISVRTDEDLRARTRVWA